MKLTTRAFYLRSVGRIDGARQTVLRIVGDPERIVKILSANDCEDRSEDFLLLNGRAGFHICNHGRLNEEPLLAIRASARENATAFGFPFFDILVDRLERFLIDDG